MQEPNLRASRRSKRRIRSVVKRTLLKFMNRSNAYFMQRAPDWLEAYEPQLATLREAWVAWGRAGNEADQVRLIFIISMVEHLKELKIPGAFAELGVFQGHTAKLFNELDPNRDLYLFDTFAGFSQHDLAKETGDASADHFKNTSLEQVRGFLGDKKNIVFCPGYFPESAAGVPAGQTFAMVHLDCDLYQPTHEGLKFFYPRLAPGGLMILHDYKNSVSWPGVKKAVDEFLADKKESLILIPDLAGTAAFTKCK